MFKVGMGVSPPIPENLGDEGKDFLSHCLDHDPETRWTAVMLRDHPFAKVSLRSILFLGHLSVHLSICLLITLFL